MISLENGKAIIDTDLVLKETFIATNRESQQ